MPVYGPKPSIKDFHEKLHVRQLKCSRCTSEGIGGQRSQEQCHRLERLPHFNDPHLRNDTFSARLGIANRVPHGLSWTRLLSVSSLAVNVKGFREMALYQVEMFGL